MAERASARQREAAFARLGELVRDSMSGDVSPRAHVAGRERMLAALESQRSARHVGWKVLPAAALAAAAAVLLYLAFGRPAPLSWQIEGASAPRADYVAAPMAGGDATVRFSDGSDVRFAPGSHGRIGPASGHKTHVTLEGGRVRARLRPVAQMAWIIDAGPFAITTNAASVDVGWSSRGEVLDVHLDDGKAVVRGPLAADGVAVAPGQRFVAEVQAGRVRLESSNDKAASADSAEPPTFNFDDLEAPTQGPALAPHRSSWTEQVAHGGFDAVLDEAHTRGIEATLTRGSLADLVALADAARYRGRTALARRVLLAERARFGSSSEARTAAFLLGRLSEDADHSPEEALGWYDRYLAEAPQGPFAAEALGRRLNALAQTAGPNAARGPAQEYLRRYPQGAYAAVARDLLRGP